MPQTPYDALLTTISSRYLLSAVVGTRAGQLKYGVPTTVTGKPVPRDENVVSAAMKEVASSAGIIWGSALPSAHAIRQVIDRERRQRAAEIERINASSWQEDDG